MITGSISQLRRIVNEPSTSGTYSDAVLSDYLEQYGGELYAVASEIWGEKASALAGLFDHSSDGENIEITQKRDFALAMSAKYANKRVARSSLWVKAPDEVGDEDELQ